VFLLSSHARTRRKDLDEQLHAIEERKKCGGIDWNTIDRERVMKDVDAYHAEEKKKMAERKAFLIGDRDIRAQQIRDTIIRRQQEKERNLREEERLVLRVQAEIEAEKQRVKAIKEAGLEAVKTVMVENMRQRAIKDEIKRKDEEHSMKLQKQYIAMLEKQERDRHAAMQNILEMQERSQAIYSASVGATLSGQAAEDEARAAATQAEFNRARTEKDKEKAKERLAMEQAVQDSLFEQIQARARVAKEEKERNDSYSKNIQEAMAKMALAEEAAKLERARMAAKTKKDLDDQMADIIKRRSEDLNMSKHERLLNAKIMQKVRAGEMDVKFDKEQFERTGISWMALKRASPF
jgi:hypothetical protein